MALRVEDYARFALAGIVGLWVFAALGLFASAFSTFAAVRGFALVAVVAVAVLLYRGRRVGLAPEWDENVLTGNVGQPRVPVTVGLSHVNPPHKAAPSSAV